MTYVKTENIVAQVQLADYFNIDEIVEKIPDFNYNPDEFQGLTMKLDHPKTAVLILANGKAICTGAKKIEDAEAAIKKVKDILKKANIAVKSKLNIETQNMVVSADMKKELHLSSISSGLVLENVTYEPDQFPGLVYRMDDIGVVILVFSSGKIVCTGAKNIDDASKAIETMKDKLSSIGAL